MTSPSSGVLPALSHLELIRAAVLAPSPDNNQPWRFTADGPSLQVHLDPRLALPSDVNGMFDLVGVGAAIENAVIAARQLGRNLEIEYHDNLATGSDEGLRHIATLTPSHGAEADPLHPYLDRRNTCRKLYSARSVETGVLEQLAQAAASFAEVELEWISDRRRIRAFARVVAASDQYRFQYRAFHEEIFRQLRFTAEEAEQTRDGLDVRTLELPPGVAYLLRWLRPWRRMERLQKLRLDRLLTFPSLLSVVRSGTLGVVSVPEPSPRWFLDGGRAFQRIWLAAAKEGLSLHPLGSLPVFLAHLEQLDGRRLSTAHQKLAAQLGERLRELAPSARGRTLLMLFRIGCSPDPTTRSLRQPAESVFH